MLEKASQAIDHLFLQHLIPPQLDLVSVINKLLMKYLEIYELDALVFSEAERTLYENKLKEIFLKSALEAESHIWSQQTNILALSDPAVSELKRKLQLQF